MSIKVTNKGTYYAFVALYTISMLLIISEDDVDRSNERYSTLLVNVSDNMKKMKLLFGNYLGK